MIDLDRYLNRIRYDGPREPTLATLTAICAAHPAAIAFENFDPLLGRTPDLTPAALEAKLVAQRRGGYCFEHNTLLRHALQMLGMRVTGLAARVVFLGAQDAPVRARTHMLLKVELPSFANRSASTSASAPAAGETFIADAGFGGHVLGAPLRFEPGLEQATPTGPQRISKATDGYHAVEARIAEEWLPLYRFTMEPQFPVDYEPLNWFTATHPNSIFRHNLLLERLTADQRASMLNDRLTLRPSESPPTVRRVESAEDFARVLQEVFDLQPPVAAADLFERFPKCHEGLFVPPVGL